MRFTPTPFQVGDRYGKLVICCAEELTSEGPRFVQCRCDCGKEIWVCLSRLMSGAAKACGCLRGKASKTNHLIHGEASRAKGESTEYVIWSKMKERCNNPKHKFYGNYGGRGIKVCEKWSESFVAFLADVGRRPGPKMSLDRIDNAKGYEPGNVKWSTRKEQARNSRRAKMLTFQGETLCIVDWEKKLGLPLHLIAKRLRRGWSVEDALTKPPHTQLLPKGRAPKT